MSFGIRTDSGLPGIIPFVLFRVAGELQSDDEQIPATFVCLGSTAKAGDGLRLLPTAAREVPQGIDWVRGRRLGELNFGGCSSLDLCFDDFFDFAGR